VVIVVRCQMEEGLCYQDQNIITARCYADQWSQNVWPWTTSRHDSRCFVLALQ